MHPQDAPCFWWANWPLGTSDKLLCFCVFLVWPHLRQQHVSVAPFCHYAPSGCTMILIHKLASGHLWPIAVFFCVFCLALPASTDSKCSTHFTQCTLRMHFDLIDVLIGLWAPLTNCCVFVFFLSGHACGPASTARKCRPLSWKCTLRMHHAFDAQGCLAVLLTSWCVFVFFAWLRLRQQDVSVAPILHSAPSGCTAL